MNKNRETQKKKVVRYVFCKIVHPTLVTAIKSLFLQPLNSVTKVILQLKTLGYFIIDFIFKKQVTLMLDINN